MLNFPELEVKTAFSVANSIVTGVDNGATKIMSPAQAFGILLTQLCESEKKQVELGHKIKELDREILSLQATIDLKDKHIEELEEEIRLSMFA